MLTPESIALQMYTLRTETAKDFLGTVRRVAEIGYPAVEFAGYGDLPVADLRAALDEYGLKAVSAHIPVTAFEQRRDEALAEAVTLGCNYVVVPYLPAERRGGEHLPGLVALLNDVGAAAKGAGLVLCYHNHAFEYEPLAGGHAGETFFDVLIANTDPDLVAFELDLFWSKVAGVDPVTELSRLSGRVPLVHLKDFTGETTAESAAPVGTGSLPWPRLIDAANAAGTVWGIVEQDFPKDPFADVATSLANARKLLAQ
ncbi:MAG: sugar phosphate isomerase/epimerase [Chloroflexota bacterium]|nr:sugar phosphate isomerase/epimerase [Chloroflexota bacterium]